ncbi:MAG: DUF1634 domain-containing protein [Acidobacteria bacterium]|nr:DUF1634 domain-containing protein [Acidobacteriota bacterium]
MMRSYDGFEIRNPGQWTDRRVEQIVGKLLRVGVGLSALVILTGAAVYLLRHASDATNYRVFHQTQPELRHVRGIAKSALALEGRGIIQLGLLLLIATPVARVAFSIFGFLEEGDMMYAVFTAIVLAILLFSLNATV